MAYRVLGSPYALVLHQHVAYLRLRRQPFKVYCRTLTTTLFYALLFRARNAFCTVTPDGKSHLQMWQLVDAVERSGIQSVEDPFLVKKRTHPNIHLATWSIFVYASWWLAKTGAMYRWVDGESIEVVEGYFRYFLLIPGIGVPRAIVRQFRQAMQRLTSVTGVSKETAPYMHEHFQRLCGALEEHFQQHAETMFLLGTPHPTLADVSMGAAFSANFLMDDPPASFVVQKFPHLNRYLERVTGWRGGFFVGAEHTEEMNEWVIKASDGYADVIPESLSAFFQLIEEVMPFMLSQCAAFHAFMAGDGVRQLKREPLEEPWKGCSGYLVPQVTEIKSLMIIDNGVYTVRARAQDLEVALLAAREVVDDDFNTDDEGLGEVAEASTQKMTSASPTLTHETLRPEAGSKTRAVVSSDTSVDNKVAAEMDAGDSLAGDADFHRVFTKSNYRQRGVLPMRRGTSNLSSIAVDSRLDALRTMLYKMHHPHYTLSSVFHGRKMFVAIIPEYEVDRKRKETKGGVV
ncbi:hypothetical protein TCDM_02208 [Trypanosoma cruzi Dm28c]|uniref:Glutathione S-transferase n=2 Tax=Trypanosoma cruzi TaxID=5693 RepID=V5B6S7_TRYCR|nr:hypothetical protein TCDM_02208 [Trypanosoma cruzi Dm28c]KAF8286704.1 putative Glutathione S-transferase, C-terminal domain containing protein [Trypanosoma cruzi]PBJ75027.1 hypothetical protein BCY84_11680 [Trypanosoma cruzi cruzi]PWU92045.1 hypothetical protein C4B63_40g100 [Trypanosoma cruzi]